MWSVTVDRSTAKRLREHDWSHVHASDPFVPNRGPGDAWRIRLIGGRCFFLDENDRCRIHSEISYEAKPAGCKAFPLFFSEVDGVSYARLSFYCPTVTADQGKRLRDQQRWVRSTRKSLGNIRRDRPLMLDQGQEIGWRRAEQLHDLIAEWFKQSDHSVADRLAAGAALLQRAREAVAERDDKAISSVVNQAQREGLETLAQQGRQAGDAGRAGPVLSLFLAADCGQGKLSRIAHFFGVRAFNVGLAALNSRFMEAKARRSAIRRVRFDPPTTNNALLTRYFSHKLHGRSHLGSSETIMVGFNLLVSAYGVLRVLACLRAASEGRGECNDDDVASAVQAADLLVVEHATAHRNPLFAQLAARILGQQGLCGSMLKRLEPNS